MIAALILTIIPAVVAQGIDPQWQVILSLQTPAETKLVERGVLGAAPDQGLALVEYRHRLEADHFRSEHLAQVISVQDGKVLAATNIEPRLTGFWAMSGDGSLVVMTCSLGAATTPDNTVSIWHTRQEGSSFEDRTGFEGYDGMPDGCYIVPLAAGRPAVSYDGGRLAFYGELVCDRPQPSTTKPGHVLALVDLEHEQVQLLQMPVSIGRETAHYWELAWGSSSDELVGVVHDDFVEERHDAAMNAYHKVDPERRVVRWDVKSGKAENLGVLRVPILGLAEGARMVVAVGCAASTPPHVVVTDVVGYRVLPVESGLAATSPGSDASERPGTRTVVAQGQQAGWKVMEVYVGRKAEYAGVCERGAAVPRVLLLAPRSTQATK